MKDKIITIIQHLTFIIAVFLAVFAVFAYSMMLQLFDSSVIDVIGKALWFIIYILLPIVVFIVPLVIQRSFKASALLAIVLILIYATISLGTYAGIHKYMQGFTSDKWEKYPKVRYLMLDDLADKYNFIGMNKDEVIDILGESKAMYADPGDKDIIDYYTGAGFIDPEMLSFEFQDNIVVDAYTYAEFREARKPLY